MRICHPQFAVPALLALLPAALPARDIRVTVAPAPVDRAGEVISFPLSGNRPENPRLRDAMGRAIPVQVDSDGTARFVVAAQKAGEALVYTLDTSPAAPRNQVEAAPAGGDLRITVGGQPVLHFRMDRTLLPRDDIKPEIVRAGYVHPVFSPSGRIVTDDYPSNHAHHHGIWAPWTKTSFQGRTPDFWNMQDKKGAEDLKAVDRTWNGPVHGGFMARLRSVDRTAPTPIDVLHTQWVLTAYDVPAASRPVRMFDLVITHVCAGSDPLILPEYHYGGFGLRGSGAWNGPGAAARFLTSEGHTDRIKGNNTRARWVYLGGPLEGGELSGTVTLDHPKNFRAPQPVRLHPNMPYFSLVPQQLGEFRIEPGQPLVMRYRFIVFDGPPDRALIDAYWNAYASSGTVKVEGL